jgi:hypothetical protein
MNEYDKGFVARIIATLILLLFIRQYTFNTNLFLPLVLSFLDSIDSAYTQNYGTFAYKMRDKIADSFSYLFVCALFPVDVEFVWAVMYRMLGVLIFGVTRNVNWLIVAPDLAKEMLLYRSVYPDLSAFPVVILGKIVYEVYHHKIRDPMESKKY